MKPCTHNRAMNTINGRTSKRRTNGKKKKKKKRVEEAETKKDQKTKREENKKRNKRHGKKDFLRKLIRKAFRILKASKVYVEWNYLVRINGLRASMLNHIEINI